MKKNTKQPAANKKPPLSHKKITKEEKTKFAQEIIRNGGNKTQAYLSIRPHVLKKTASVQSVRLSHDPIVRSRLEEAAKALEIDETYVLKNLKKAAKAGLGRKATNKDSISALKEIASIVGIGVSSKNNDDDQATREKMANMGHQELLSQVASMQEQLKLTTSLLKSSAQDAEISE